VGFVRNRRIRSDTCNPQGLDPLGCEGRTGRAASIYPHHFRSRCVGLTWWHARDSASTVRYLQQNHTECTPDRLNVVAPCGCASPEVPPDNGKRAVAVDPEALRRASVEYIKPTAGKNWWATSFVWGQNYKIERANPTPCWSRQSSRSRARTS